MTCENVREKLGLLVDAQLDGQQRAHVQHHVEMCPGCAAEVESLQAMADALAPRGDSEVPGSLWSAIEVRLTGAPSDAVPAPTTPRWGGHRLLRSTWVKAAALALTLGLGLWGVSLTGPRVRAASIDFSVLLESVELNPRQAFQRFLERHNARPGSPRQAMRHARNLNVALPDNLPGGFRLDGVYLLDFGGAPGIAAAYFRGDEFLAALFHPPVLAESYGTSKDYDCVIGKHRGHKVEAGEWKLVHLTDATTCRCVLSRLDEDRELPAILEAVAPHMKWTGSHDYP